MGKSSPLARYDRNGSRGIYITNSSATTYLGGDNWDKGNTISGNTASGIVVINSIGNTRIMRNLIGISQTQTAAIPNDDHGINITNSSNTVVGYFGYGNVISANGINGINISNSSGTEIYSNRIGTDWSGVTDFGNGNHGIILWTNTNNVIIGGVNTGFNTIAYNTKDGVAIGNNSHDNIITKNSFYCNGDKAIDIYQGGSAANNGQASPVITSAGNSTISGTSNPDDKIEIYISEPTTCIDTECEGKTYLDFVYADPSGNWSYSDTFTTGDFVTATATSLSGSTSEFALCKEVGVVYVSPKVYLQGPYTSGQMNSTLQSLIPLSQPYAPDYNGTESIMSLPNSNIVDWVLVELRNPPTNVIATRAAFLLKDGSVVDLDGSSAVRFEVASGSYYIAVQHRNHLGIMTKLPMMID